VMPPNARTAPQSTLAGRIRLATSRTAEPPAQRDPSRYRVLDYLRSRQRATRLPEPSPSWTSRVALEGLQLDAPSLPGFTSAMRRNNSDQAVPGRKERCQVRQAAQTLRGWCADLSGPH